MGVRSVIRGSQGLQGRVAKKHGWPGGKEDERETRQDKLRQLPREETKTKVKKGGAKI